MNKYGYMCKTDYDNLYNVESISLYSSIKELETVRPCVKKDCGIVKVKLSVELVEILKDNRPVGREEW